MNAFNRASSGQQLKPDELSLLALPPAPPQARELSLAEAESWELLESLESLESDSESLASLILAEESPKSMDPLSEPANVEAA